MTLCRSVAHLAALFCVFACTHHALAAPPPEDEAHAEEGAEDTKESKDDEVLTCMEEPVGDWLVAYDGYEFRAWNQAAEISWNLRTHLDPEITSGFLVKIRRPRKSLGYVRRPEVEIWYNPPKITLANSHGKEYYAFGKALSHSYERAIGFGMEQYWLETNQFWYPREEIFTVQTRQTNARKAMKFEKSLATGAQKLRVELFVPMYSSSDPVGYGELEDTAGLAAAMKHAAAKNHELYQIDAECRMGALVLEEAPAEDKKSDGH